MKITLFDRDNWNEIGATLARNKTRTFLTGFGIFWGVFMLACLMGGARGAEDMLRRNFNGFATNSAFLFAGRTTLPYKGHQKNRNWNLDNKDVERLRQMCPELSTITTQSVNSNNSFRNGRYTFSGSVWGVEDKFTDVMLPTIESGRFINEADNSLGRKVAVVGKKVINEIFPGVTDVVGREILINGISYKIIGVAYQTSKITMNDRIDNVVMIPRTTFQRVYNVADKVDAIMLIGAGKTDMTALEDRFRHIIYQNHTIAPDDKGAMWYMNISEEFAKVDNMFAGVTFLAAFIGLSTLIAGIIGIGNIMWVIVKERTQEIGIRRAIGARPVDVTMQILSEGTVLTAVAGMSGIVLAVVVLAVTAMMTDTPSFQMSMWQALEIFIGFLVLGTLAGIIPALKAMRIKPIEALNDK